SAYTCLAVAPPTFKAGRFLACGRETGQIEIRNANKKNVPEKVMVGSETRSIESIAWVHQASPEEKGNGSGSRAPLRLFSAGLHGFVEEWDLNNSTIKRSYESGEGPIWSMAVNHNHTLLAIGCDKGSVRVFDITDSELAYRTTFTNLNERIVAVTWHPSRNQLYSSTILGNVSVWDMTTGGKLGEFHTPAKAVGNNPAQALLVLACDTIVTGLASGQVNFYDGDSLTLLHAFPAHRAGVTCLAADPTGTQVFSGSIDMRVGEFHSTALTNESDFGTRQGAAFKQWHHAQSTPRHKHDIRALIEYTQPQLAGISHSPALRCLALAPEGRFLLGFANDQLRLYKIPQEFVLRGGAAAANFNGGSGNGQSLSPGSLHVQGLAIVLNLRLDSGGSHVVSADISPDGRWIAVSDNQKVRLFAVERDPSVADEMVKGSVTLTKMPHFPPRAALPARSPVAGGGGAGGIYQGAQHLRFTPDGDHLIMVNYESVISVIDLTTWPAASPTVVHQFNHHSRRRSTRRALGPTATDGASTPFLGTSAQIRLLTVSDDGQWLATCDDHHVIHVFDLHRLAHSHTIVRQKDLCTALRFHPTRPYLVLGFVSNRVLIYSLLDSDVNDWTRASLRRPPVQFAHPPEYIQGIAVDPTTPDDLVVWTPYSLC
ncbi:WD40-repeat-containing domain protein, partial [Dimargaris cristalligena]